MLRCVPVLREETGIARVVPGHGSKSRDHLKGSMSSIVSRKYLVIAATVSGLGGLLFGFDNIVISGAIPYLTQLFHLDATGVGWAAGCALIGCIAGAMSAGAFVPARSLQFEVKLRF
jgi:hypothetical protein